MQELEGVNSKFSLAQWALYIRGGGLAIILRLVEVPDVLLHSRGSAGLPFLGRRFMAGAQVTCVLVPGALVAVRAHLQNTNL